MRRVGHLFDHVHDFETLRRAARRARRGKRMRPDVLRFHLREEDALHELGESLRAGSWRPSGYSHFKVFEPKERWISAAPYADRVVHHAICAIIEPELERRMSGASYANRRGRGSHRAVLAAQAALGSCGYVLKLDVRQYFPSIDHALLQGQLARVFKERKLLQLLEYVVESGARTRNDPPYLPEDDLFAPYDRPSGLPIGNLTSQLLGNYFLSAFDRWVAQELKPQRYIRFMDDLLVFDREKRLLERAHAAIERELLVLRLRLHPKKTLLQPCREGVSFLGYVVEPARVRVRGVTLRRLRRRLRRARGARATNSGERPPGRASYAEHLAAWRGHTRWAGSWRQLP